MKRIVDGTVVELSPAEEKAYHAQMTDRLPRAEAAAKKLLNGRIDRECKRRIRTGFTFQGHTYEANDHSLARISQAAQWADSAISHQGKLEGDYRWHDGAEDYFWIDADNNRVGMDAPTVVALGRAAAAHVNLCVVKARDLKDLEEGPANYQNKVHWT